MNALILRKGEDKCRPRGPSHCHSEIQLTADVAAVAELA